MKKGMYGFLLLLLLVIVTACSNVEAEGDNAGAKSDDSKEKITLKFAVSQPTTHTMNKVMYTPFMEEVTKRTDGQVEFEFYPSEQLGKIDDLLDLTGNGVADIGMYIPNYYSSKMPITSNLMNMPGLFESSYEGSVIYHEIIKENESLIKSDYANNGIIPLFSLASPLAEFWTNGKEIKVPNDIQGMKIRISSELTNKAMKDLKASPINITMAEMYEGMERGVFNGMLLNGASTKDYGMEDLVKYGTVGAGFGGGLLGVGINEKVFNGLPEQIQDVLIEVGDELTESVAQHYDDYTNEVISQFEDAGVKMHRITEEEYAVWKKFYEDFEEAWTKSQDSPDLDAVLQSFKKKVIEHRE